MEKPDLKLQEERKKKAKEHWENMEKEFFSSHRLTIEDIKKEKNFNEPNTKT